MKTTWKRLDESKLKNVGGKNGVRRVYGLDGKLWPRLVICVFPTLDAEDEGVFKVSCIKKVGPGAWWEEVYIPEVLRSELLEVLAE